VADAHDLHVVADGSVDCIVYVSVLMYCWDPARVIQEFFRILKPGGVIYLSTPFVFPYAPDRIDYLRVSYEGLEKMCEQFERLDSGFNRGPASTMTHLLVHFFAMLFSFNSRRLYAFNTDLFKWLLFWVKYLDLFLARFHVTHVIHSGAFLIGRKPTTIVGN
jgi:SAM-dependent methyltransferase